MARQGSIEKVRKLATKVVSGYIDVSVKATDSANRLAALRERAVKAFGANSREVRKIDALHTSAVSAADKAVVAARRSAMDTDQRLRVLSSDKEQPVGKESSFQKASGAGGEGVGTDPLQKGYKNSITGEVSSGRKPSASIADSIARRGGGGGSVRSVVSNSVPPGTPGGRWITINGAHVFVK